MASSFLENLPTHFFRVPPVSERRPFDTSTFFAYIVPTLVILPGTRVLRIALWPLVALLAFRATMGIDLTGGDPQKTFFNVDFALIMFCFVVRTFEWTTAKDPLKRHLRPTGSSPSIFMDALDLSTNVRGIGWNWSKSLPYVLLSTWYHSIHFPETFTVLSGGTIFDATLPPLILAIFAVMQLIYDIATLIGVIVASTVSADIRCCRGWPLGIAFGRMGYVLGSFLASGVVHNIVVVMLNQNVEWWCMLLAFGMMAVGVLLEHMFTRMTGKEVGGWVGRVWSMAWLLVWGSIMMDGFARAGLLASTTLLDTACPVKGIVEYYVTVLDRWLRECAS
ncbi:hypothetical protein BKA82DRAFT_4250756 [Pisolithus tinctorius]|nr:hypothetical protein BKA82DRAFT_4250756 [Pisolithus tinctorius]